MESLRRPRELGVGGSLTKPSIAACTHKHCKEIRGCVQVNPLTPEVILLCLENLG